MVGFRTWQRLGRRHSWRGGRRLGVPAALMALGAGLLTGCQPAGTNATIEATAFSVAPTTAGEAFAVCPSGKRALGGGVVESGPPSGLVVRASGPLDETGTTSQTVDGDVAKQWYASVLNNTSQTVNFKVFAVCSTITTATIEASEMTVLRGGRASTSAACPGDMRALGGGLVQSGSASGLRVLHSGPGPAVGPPETLNDGGVAKRWLGYLRNTRDQNVVVKVFAICSETVNATIEASDFSVAAGATGEAYAVCPDNKRVLGGGIVPFGEADVVTIVTASGPLDESGFTAQTVDGDTARQWYAAAKSEDVFTSVRVFGICE
jgi:hypothetical protein